MTTGRTDPAIRAAVLEQRAQTRIALVRMLLARAISEACLAEPDMTYGDLVDALAGATHRYAQHFRLTDTVPIALPDIVRHDPVAVDGPATWVPPTAATAGLVSWTLRQSDAEHPVFQLVPGDAVRIVLADGASVGAVVSDNGSLTLAVSPFGAPSVDFTVTSVAELQPGEVLDDGRVVLDADDDRGQDDDPDDDEDGPQ